MREANQQIGCAHCGAANKSRNREFSAQIWAVLHHWGEVDGSVVGRPICDSCYRELRNLLIDRSEEMESVIKNGLPEVKPSSKSSAHAPAVAKKAEKGEKKSRVKMPKAS